MHADLQLPPGLAVSVALRSKVRRRNHEEQVRTASEQATHLFVFPVSLTFMVWHPLRLASPKHAAVFRSRMHSSLKNAFSLTLNERSFFRVAIFMSHAEGFGDFEPRFREEAASARGDAGGAAPARAARSAQDEKSARLQRLATKIDNERETVTPSSRISAEVLPQLHFAIDIIDKKSRRRRSELVLGCIEADFSNHM